MFILTFVILQFSTADLLNFLPRYGETTPDVTPAFVNYYQDIFPNSLSKLDNLTEPSCDCTYKWFLDDQLVFEGEDLLLDTVVSQINCEGVFRLRLEVTDSFLGSKYSREEWAFLEFVEIENFCECESCPNYWEVFYDFYPPVPSYFYLTEDAEWDLNNDKIVNVNDLLILLADF
jgi:hypothetical protein